MHIEELNLKEKANDGGVDIVVAESGGDGGDSVLIFDVKRVIIGIGARMLFYPTLMYNVARFNFEPEFHWWDRVDELILLGAVPFPADVPRLKDLGVHGVVTLNESYETLVPSSLYQTYGINHLVIATRDYCFAPSLSNICQAVDFIYDNASCGKTTYVHCKAGRGRSTTVVLCYLVKHKQMTPGTAYEYVRSVRPRIRLASSQWQAVQEFYHLMVRTSHIDKPSTGIVMKSTWPGGSFAFDDGSVVVVTQYDLDGFDPSLLSGTAGGRISALSVVCRARVVGQAALARISCLWLQCHQNTYGDKMALKSACLVGSDHLGGISVDIHVY